MARQAGRASVFGWMLGLPAAVTAQLRLRVCMEPHEVGEAVLSGVVVPLFCYAVHSAVQLRAPCWVGSFYSMVISLSALSKAVGHSVRMSPGDP